MSMTKPQVAIVTGASRGIGRAVAVELGRLGLSVIVNYASRAEVANHVVADLRELGAKAMAFQADVASADDRERLVDRTLDEFGRVDVLINNAGITSPGRDDLLDATEASWDRVFGVNLKGPFFLSQRVAREMIRLIHEGHLGSGKIINISSISAYAVSTNRADYCLAKSALETMTQLYAARLAEERITVFEVCPGVIETDMTAPVKQKYDRLLAEGLAPMRRWGKAEDVAKAVSAIVADYFPYSTGQRIHVDGGFHIRRL